MIALHTIPLDPATAAYCALFDVSGAAADFAQELIEREAQDPEDFGAPEVDLPPIAVVDQQGRAITAVRLDRESGTSNFRIVLLTGPSL